MIRQENLLPVENKQQVPFLYRTGTILLLILLLAASLRLYKLGQISPPGFNQDEAVNAWNAWCLLKTGKDQTGASWPVFYLHTLGSNNTPLYIYSMIPFFAAGGLSIWTARLVSAVFGILCIPLIYYIGYRLFDRRVGLVAAILLALNPWHLQLSRWAIEGSLCPFLGLAPLALMLWAKMPLRNDKNHTPRPVPAALAGALTGICCYGYWPILFFIPATLATVAIVTLPEWLHSLKTRKGSLAVAVFILSFAATFGPLASRYLTDSENIAKRAQKIWIWNESDPPAEKIKAVLSRYIKHFGPDFLFIEGDHYQIQSPPNAGQYHWYTLPLMLAGLMTLLKNLKTSYAARILLVYVLVYPVGDCLSSHYGSDGQLSLHALRSSPGLCSLILLSAVGAVGGMNWLWKQNRTSAITAIAALAIAVIGLNTRYFYHFYGEYNRRPEIYHDFHVDFLQACQWLRPRFDQFDAVFCTTRNLSMPYVVSLVMLGYDPNRWFSEPKEFFTEGEFDCYTRYGKMYFMYDKFFKPPAEQFRADRVLLIIRPNEIPLPDPARQVIQKISRPDGTVTLWLCRI
jgi:4-amino-4-deoxy-L-arabinose transferase-like glycosyltransferase